MKKSKKLLYEGTDWTLSDIDRIWDRIDKIAKEKYSLDYYTPEICLVSSRYMQELSSMNGMPLYYNHWSFGKAYEKYHKDAHPALEMIINSNPALTYLLEDNTITYQADVLAHACVGHSSFFKNNYLFKDYTNADFILEFLKYTTSLISRCEEKYGVDKIEDLIQVCHFFQDYSIDRFPRKYRKNVSSAEDRHKDINQHNEDHKYSLWQTIPGYSSDRDDFEESETFLIDSGDFPQENILKFAYNNSRALNDDLKEIVKSLQYLGTYFYPQMTTKVMNEGYATVMGYILMSDLYDQGYISHKSYMEHLVLHSNLLYQSGIDGENYTSLNPYRIGYDIFNDVKRICETQDKEDLYFLPALKGENWNDVFKDIVRSYNDSSFIYQWLSPKVVKDWKMFVVNDSDPNYYLVSDVQSTDDFYNVKEKLSTHYEYDYNRPSLDIVDFDPVKSKVVFSLKENYNKEISEDLAMTISQYLTYLMGGNVYLRK